MPDDTRFLYVDGVGSMGGVADPSYNLGGACYLGSNNGGSSMIGTIKNLRIGA
jgi:hypothetical protein